MPRKREDTQSRIVKRNYEARHKDERKEKNVPFGTSLNREYAEEVNAFLKENKITKVELIIAGYQALQEKYPKNST